MEFNLETSHYLELEFKLSRAIVLCWRLWFKVGNKCRDCNYFTWVRVDLNKSSYAFIWAHFLILFIFVFVCLMFFLSCVTTRGFVVMFMALVFFMVFFMEMFVCCSRCHLCIAMVVVLFGRYSWSSSSVGTTLIGCVCSCSNIT